MFHPGFSLQFLSSKIQPKAFVNENMCTLGSVRKHLFALNGSLFMAGEIWCSHLFKFIYALNTLLLSINPFTYPTLLIAQYISASSLCKS